MSLLVFVVLVFIVYFCFVLFGYIRLSWIFFFPSSAEVSASGVRPSKPFQGVNGLYWPECGGFYKGQLHKALEAFLHVGGGLSAVYLAGSPLDGLELSGVLGVCLWSTP